MIELQIHDEAIVNLIQHWITKSSSSAVIWSWVINSMHVDMHLYINDRYLQYMVTGHSKGYCID